MGKKVKKKARSVQKEKRALSPSPKILPEQCSINAEAPQINGVLVVKERGVCSHIDKGIDWDKLSAKLDPSEPSKCEYCRESALDRRENKGKNKHVKKGGINSKSESKAIWICLGCGHFSCGGVGFPTISNSHAVRHAKQNHHPLAIQFENLQLLWCFPCNKLLTFEKPEDIDERKNVIHEVTKMLKARPSKGSAINVVDVWFGSGSGTSTLKSECSVSNKADGRVGYSVRGLINLGNSCFFNSIMQNLLAINQLRDYLFKFDESVGPLGASLRKLFLETSAEAGLKGVINPRSLFGSVCSKAPQFRGYQQHDSHELLRCLLDGLCTEELSARKPVKSSLADRTSIAKPTFVDAIFGGQLSSTVSCLECGHSSTIYEPFLDLSLPIPTKKPPSKRLQPVTRSKKIKPPLKQDWRIRSKVNRDEPILPAESFSDQSTFVDSYSELQPRAQPVELPVDSASSMSIDLNAVVLDMGLTHQDLSDSQQAKNQPEVDNVVEQSISSNVLTWLDYLEPNPVSNDYVGTSETYEMSADHGSADKNVFQNDVSLPITLDSRIGSNLEFELAVSTMPLDGSHEFNPLDQVIVTHQQDASSQYVETQNEISQSDEKLSTDHSLTKEVVQLNADVYHSLVNDSTVEVCSSGWDNENPSQVKESEVILLPYKEDVSSCFELLGEEIEITSEVVGDEHGSQEFDGFGDLFNEPEVTLELGPSYTACEATDAVKNGVLGNSSDSDPGEVDNSDVPVSVDSCLAFFTKPELLSKDEHAWQCDNCSKVLQQGTRRKLRKLKANIVPNGCDDINAIGPLEGCNSNLHEVEIISGMMENDAFDGSNGKLVPHNQEMHNISNSMLTNHQETKMNMIACQLENQVSVKLNLCHGMSECSSFNCQILCSCCGKRESDCVGLAETDLLPEKCESEVSEGEEVDSKSLKVKRDATKNILISKAPSVLTIHLKRFSLNARGRLSKLNGHVNFRETIDLNPYMKPRCTNGEKLTYRLLGAVEHSGSMRSGHYVAYVREGEGDSTIWYYASDTHVRQVSLEEVLSCDAYILFYEET